MAQLTPRTAEMSETGTPSSDGSRLPSPQEEQYHQYQHQQQKQEEEEKHLDSLFDATMESLEVLENSRAVLHSSMQEAHFSFNVTQREMERSGLLLAWDAVPTQEGAVQPLIGIRIPAIVRDTNSGNEKKKNCDDNDKDSNLDDNDNNDDNNNNDDDKWSLVEMNECEGRDPLRWFAAVPSPALCACQEHFRRVLHACVDVLQAQKEVLAAAELYREAAEKRELHQ
ncbi:uncharacterized protein TM35_000292200 [Trypanosoma theileri]|uniref:Vacuolar ATPase assembly protein VMA22 n=1 Tax=Trypanosoma theileri TaxID=67003 RepID=A0A1X0NP94_9TRYP|nr:uncharacterized protein TM35_000292200 [Trypanosoma theileri]ORC86338.1 hypothetical protein TM35_000292200 [Trypanosoma theileri]